MTEEPIPSPAEQETPWPPKQPDDPVRDLLLEEIRLLRAELQKVNGYNAELQSELQAAQTDLLQCERNALAESEKLVAELQEERAWRERLQRSELAEHEDLKAAQELTEAAIALADYWPNPNVEKHYSPKMQRFLKAVRATQRSERCPACGGVLNNDDLPWCDECERSRSKSLRKAWRHIEERRSP